MTAAGFCNENLVLILLEAGADVNACVDGVGTALHVALENGRYSTRIIKLLLKYGASPFVYEGKKGPPLSQAIRFAAVDDNLRLLMEAMGPSSLEHHLFFIGNLSRTDATIEQVTEGLALLAEERNPNAAAGLIRAWKNTFKIEFCSEILDLYRRLKKDNVKTEKRASALVSWRSRYYNNFRLNHIRGFFSALQLAASQGRADMVEALLAAGVREHRPCGSKLTALMAAARHGHVGCTTLLLKASPYPEYVNARYESGETALHFASTFRPYPHQIALNLVRVLVEAGADFQARDSCGLTPLALSCLYGSSALVEYFIAVADDNVADLLRLKPDLTVVDVLVMILNKEKYAQDISQEVGSFWSVNDLNLLSYIDEAVDKIVSTFEKLHQQASFSEWSHLVQFHYPVVPSCDLLSDSYKRILSLLLRAGAGASARSVQGPERRLPPPPGLLSVEDYTLFLRNSGCSEEPREAGLLSSSTNESPVVRTRKRAHESADHQMEH